MQAQKKENICTCSYIRNTDFHLIAGMFQRWTTVLNPTSPEELKIKKKEQRKEGRKQTKEGKRKERRKNGGRKQGVRKGKLRIM